MSLHMTFRISPELRDRLAAAAGDRPIGEEIRRRLEASFAETPTAAKDPWFDALVSAIHHAAAGAVELKRHPVLPAGVMDRDGKRRPYDVDRLGPDTTAYESFVTAVHMLMEALSPEGVVAVSTETGLRLADHLVALALGSLGERGIAAIANLSEIDRQFMKQSGGRAQAFAEEAEARLDEEDKP
jgi:hypothetical protein